MVLKLTGKSTLTAKKVSDLLYIPIDAHLTRYVQTMNRFVKNLLDTVEKQCAD